MAFPSSGEIDFDNINSESGSAFGTQVSLGHAGVTFTSNTFGTEFSINELYAPPLVRYYGVNPCLGGSLEYTKTNPAAGVGQRYRVPGSPDIFYTYGGTFVDQATDPIGYNVNIIIVFGSTGCP
jgi:hypothetical protein